MSYLGDFRAGDTVDFKFTSRDGGVPFTLVGSPVVSVYKGNSTTESTSGITLTVDFDSRTGLNHVRITTVTDGTFYAAGSEFQVVITTGTVNGNSVVGEVVAEFSIANRKVQLADAAHGGTSATWTAEREIIASTTANEPGVKITGNGTAPAVSEIGGATGPGRKTTGGSSSGAGWLIQTNSGHAINLDPTGGDGLHSLGNGAGNCGIRGIGANASGGNAAGEGISGLGGSATTTGGGTAGRGILSQGGSGAASTNPAGEGMLNLAGTAGAAGGADAIKNVATGSGVDIRGNITGNVTGNLSGSVGSVTARVTANSDQINGNATGAANLALQFDGTGLVGDAYPARQDQVRNIAVTGAALNVIAMSETLTTGTDTGGVGNTATLDGVYDSWADTAGTLEGYYQFDLSGTANAVAVGVTWDGYLVGVLNIIKVYARNWGASAWDQIGTINGIASVVNQAQEWDLTNAHTGTGGNLGLVRIRFQNTGLTASTLKTDRILLGYVVTPNTTTPASVSAIATAVWQDTTSGDFTVANSIGKSLYTSGAAPGAAGGFMIAGSNAATTFATLTVSGATTLSGAVSFGSTFGVTGAITATNASNDIRGVRLSAAGLAMFFTTDSTKVFADAISGSVVYEIGQAVSGGIASW